MMRILMTTVFVSAAGLLAGCDMPVSDPVGDGPSLVTQTVQFEGSDVQVSWDPAAKISATLIHDSRLSISNNAAADLIAEATGCSADPWVTSFPGAADGFQAISIPIRCG